MTKPPIKVLHVTRSIANNGGIEECIRLLAAGLPTDEFRFAVCSIMDATEDVLPFFQDSNIELFCGRRSGSLVDISANLWIQDMIRRFDADIVHTHGSKGNYHGRIAAYMQKVPIITTHHDMEDAGFAKTKSVKNYFQELDPQQRGGALNPFADSVAYPFLNVRLNCLNTKVICVSNAVRQVYTARQDKDYVTVYSSYDGEMFQERYCGLESETVTLGIVARLDLVKGHETLLRAVAELKEKGRNVRLKIIGEGEIRKMLEAEAMSLGIKELVAFCGDQPHSEKLYDGIDIYLQPSFLEGCSITLLEAMATGLPVIAGNIGGPSELVVDGKTGFLVPPGDATAIANAVIQFIDHPEEAKQMGKAAAQRARETFSLEIFLQKMQEIYREVAA